KPATKPPPPASPPPPPPASPPPPPPAAGLDAAVLEGVEILADLPVDARGRLCSLARGEALGADEEGAGFGGALLVTGSASVCATIVDERVSRAEPGTLVPTRGTFAEAVALRVVAGSSGARVAVWDQTVIDETLRPCPWVLEELAAHADRL